MKRYSAFPKTPAFVGTPPSDCLEPYPGEPLAGLLLSAEVQSVYSTIPADWDRCFYNSFFFGGGYGISTIVGYLMANPFSYV